MTKSAYLYDDFSQTIAVSGKWTTTNALTGVVSGGVMRIRPTSSYDDVQATSTYDLTGSYLGFQLIQNCAKGAGTNTITLYSYIDSNNSASIWIEGGRTLGNAATVYLRERVGGVNSDTTFTYDPAVHTWFRIREASGTIYWETSTNGTAWTTQRSKTTTLTLTSAQVIFEGGYYGAEAGTTFASIDNFNLWAGVPSAPKMETLTDSFSTADSTKWTGYDGSNIKVDTGNLSILAGSYPVLQSVDSFDLTGSYLAIQLIQGLPAGTGTFTTELTVLIDGSNAATITWEGGTAGNIYFKETVAGSSSSTSILFNAYRHKWFRIRESSGSLYWETSIDGSTWVVRRSKTTSLTLTIANAKLTAGYYGTETPAVTLLDNLNIISGTTIGSDTPLPASLLTDTFDTQDSSKWYYPVSPDGFTAESGQLKAIPTSSYVYVNTIDTWDLRNDYFAVQFVQNANKGNDSISAEFDARIDGNNKFGFVVYGGEGGILELREVVASTASTVTITYNSSLYKWLRVRSAGTTIYWEASRDGATWSILRSKTTTLTLSAMKCQFTSGYYGTEPSPGVVLFDNFNLIDTHRLNEIGWSTGAAMPFGGILSGTVQQKGFFLAADWLWNPIPVSPVLDTNSAALVSLLSASGSHHALDCWDYGVTVIKPSQITDSTPRYTFVIDNYPAWGADPLGSDTVPIPDGTENVLAPGTDTHLVVIDRPNNKVYSFWQARKAGSVWHASWGGVSTYSGDGREYSGGAVAINVSRLAAIPLLNEIEAGEIPHALFFASDISGPSYRYPAQKSDGTNLAGAPMTIDEGTRVQLDPSIDLSAISGITPGELAIGRALQKYGAYCGDQGGSRMSFITEFPAGQSSPTGTTYANAGFLWDYFDMAHIPWSSLRVLHSWDGS